MTKINQALREALGEALDILDILTDPEGNVGMSSSRLFFRAAAALRTGRATLRASRAETQGRSGFVRSTCSGIAFDLASPTPEMVDPADIAWHLSMINRWGGNLTMPYNVAQHSVLVARAIARPDWRIYGLLHDAGEAYITDLITPLKEMIGARGFDIEALEQRICAAVLQRLDLPPMTPEIAAAVHEADQRLLASEYRDVVRCQMPSWKPSAAPLPDKIEPLDCDRSCALFLSALEIHMREAGHA